MARGNLMVHRTAGKSDERKAVTMQYLGVSDRESNAGRHA
jgi:hypothetical protein